MIRHIIFDLDGTLIDSVGGLAFAMNSVLNELGLPEHPIERYRKWIGNGMYTLVENALPKDRLTNEFVNKCYVDMKNYYFEHWREELTVYAGITQVLDILTREEYGISVLSNKNQEMVNIILSEYFGAWRFEGAFGAINKETLKPSAQSVLRLTDQLKWNPEECIIIGDSEIDIQLGKNSKIPVISCTWGFRDRYFLETMNPKYLINTPMEIIQILDQMESDTTDLH